MEVNELLECQLLVFLSKFSNLSFSNIEMRYFRMTVYMESQKI